jgi:hypothetical protein
MTNLSTKIKLYANKEIDFRTDVRLQDDGNGVLHQQNGILIFLNLQWHN